MSVDCACLYFDDQGDDPSFYRKEVRKARRGHVCCECLDRIEVGDSYESVAGVWAGDFFEFKTCASCRDIRDRLSCDRFVHGELWESIGEASEDLCYKAVAKLTAGKAALEEFLLVRDSELLEEVL